jgi:cell cycle arrest protein BUB2
MAPTSELEALLRRGPGNLPITDALNDLRYKILVDGIPANSDGLVSRVNSPRPHARYANDSRIQSETRIYLWLILLNAAPIPTDTYVDLVHQGSSPAYSKIRNDTFRTLATDQSMAGSLHDLALCLHHLPPPPLPLPIPTLASLH